VEPPNLYEWGLTAGTAGIGWFARTIWTDLKEATKDLAAHKTHVAEKYATNERLEQTVGRIEAMLNRLMDELSGKQDK
jgi:hypothetical protein